MQASYHSDPVRLEIMKNNEVTAAWEWTIRARFVKHSYRCEDSEGRSFEITVRSNGDIEVRGYGDGAYFKN